MKMEKHLLLCLLVPAYTLVCLCVSTEACQPLLMEGETYGMDCSFPLANMTHFYWSIISGFPKETSRRLFSCDFIENNCDRSHLNQVSVTYSSQSTTFTSSLKIFNTTAADRDSRLQCNVAYANDDKLNTLKSCKINMYHAPESPTCQAEKIDSNETRLTCHTPKVYPGIFCKLYQEIDGEYVKMAAEMIYNKSSLHNSASCSCVLPNNTTDGTFFKVEMFASTRGRAIPGSKKSAFISPKMSPQFPIKVNAQVPAIGKSQIREKEGGGENSGNGISSLVMYTLIAAAVILVVCLGFYLMGCPRRLKSEQEDHRDTSVENMIYKPVPVNNIPA